MHSRNPLFEESPKSKKVYPYFNKRTGQILALIGLLIVLSIHSSASTYPSAALTKKNDVKLEDNINKIQSTSENRDTRGTILKILSLVRIGPRDKLYYFLAVGVVYSLKKSELVGVEAVQDIIELCLYTNSVRNERIVSLVLIGEPESSKTEMMKKYRKNIGVHVRRTITAYSVIKDLIDNKIKIRKSDKQIGHLVIYDLTDIFAYAPKTVNQAIQFFCAFIEEGLSKQGAYWIESEATKGLEGVKGGLIAGVNTFGFFTKAGKVKANLFKGGLLSRLIPFSISYSMVHVGKIFDSIRKQRYHVGKGFVDLIDLNIPQEPVEVRISKTHLKLLEDLAKDVSREISYQLDAKGQYKSPGFRLYKSFISLAKASALRDGRTIVSSNDIGRIKYLSHWMNLKMNALNQEYPDDFRRFI